MKLDPDTRERITPDGGINLQCSLPLPPSGLREPQVDHAGRLQVGDLPAGGEQGRLSP